MNRFQTAICGGLVVKALVLGGCSAMHGSTTLASSLSGASEVPPVSGSGYGSVEAKLIKQSNGLSWSITYAGLSGPPTGAHFHGPAAAGSNAGVAVPITGSRLSPIMGTATLSEPQVEALLAGQWYVNLHTAANPNGEVRGQVTIRP